MPNLMKDLRIYDHISSKQDTSIDYTERKEILMRNKLYKPPLPKMKSSG